MKVIYFLIKSIKETLRDWKVLFFTLIFGPAFVFIFHAFFSDSQTKYKVLVSNFDKPVITSKSEKLSGGYNFIKVLKSNDGSNNTINLEITEKNNKDKALMDLKNKKYDLYIIIPEDFSNNISKQVKNQLSTVKLQLYGDVGSNKYIVPAITISNLGENFIRSITGINKTLSIEEESLVDYKNRTEFEQSIPSALFIGIIMLIFTSAISLIKEVENGTIRRLQISKISPFQLISAVTLNQIIIGIISTCLTILTAIIIFNANIRGSLISVFVICILCCISAIATGFILAGFSRNITDILILGNLPYFIFFLISGAFPIPRINLFYVGSHSLAVNDIFPTTPAMTALKLVMDQGKGLRDITFELILIILLAFIYFFIGIFLFNKRHMKLE